MTHHPPNGPAVAYGRSPNIARAVIRMTFHMRAYSCTSRPARSPVFAWLSNRTGKDAYPLRMRRAELDSHGRYVFQDSYSDTARHRQTLLYAEALQRSGIQVDNEDE